MGTHKLSLVGLVILFLLGNACRSVPKNRIISFRTANSHEFKGDSLVVNLGNPLKCPVRLFGGASSKDLDTLIKAIFPIQMKAESDTTFSLYYPTEEKKPGVDFFISLGYPEQAPLDTQLVLPFPEGKTYKIIQAYYGKYSHNRDFSRFALDFSLAVGDTVCAAADGYVINAIKDYKYGGSARKWRPYANYITLYHPDKQIFTQYVHLKHLGAFVKEGDRVVAGQAIGLSGKTGFTDVAHLHFNVLGNSPKGLVSIKAMFGEGYKGEDFKKGQQVKNVKK